MGGEFSPSIVPLNAGIAKKLGTLFAVASGLFISAVLTAVLLGGRHLLLQVMDLQEAVDVEGRRKARDSLVGYLGGLSADWAGEKVFASLDIHKKATKTIVAKGVEAGQCPGVSVALQADRTGELLLQLLESLTGVLDFLCH